MKRDVSYYINDLNRLEEVSLDELYAWLDDMPFYQPLRYLISKKAEVMNAIDQHSIKAKTYFAQDLEPMPEAIHERGPVTHELASDEAEEAVESEIMEVDLTAIGGRLTESEKMKKNNEILNPDVKAGYLPIFNFLGAWAEKSESKPKDIYEHPELMSKEEVEEIRTLLDQESKQPAEEKLVSKESEVKKKKKKKKKAMKSRVRVDSEKSYEPSNFTQWLASTDGIETDESKSKKNKKKKKNKKVKTDEPKVVKEANKSNVRDKGIISENLADILANQGHESEALEMYRQLSLLFPEKSSYFAAKIEALKKIINK